MGEAYHHWSAVLSHRRGKKSEDGGDDDDIWSEKNNPSRGREGIINTMEILVVGKGRREGYPGFVTEVLHNFSSGRRQAGCLLSLLAVETEY